MRFIVPLLLAGITAGCVTNQVAEEDKPIFGRVDCQRGADNPQIQQEFEQAKAICLPRAEAAAIAGSSAIPVGYGIAGAISSGIQRGMTQKQIGEATITSCMAERGYLLKTRDEHLAMCAAIEEQKTREAEATKQKRKGKAS